MEAYFASTLDKLRTNNYVDLTVVLGNESCDLDSAASALVYAAFLNWQYNQIKCKVCTRGNRDETVYKDDIFVPVLNVDREDYELKTEVVHCLRAHGIDQTKLVFRDEIDLKTISSTNKVNVVFVDHHIPSKRDKFLVQFVTEIIDHRPIDTSNWRYNDDTRSTIELVGSCCTLVAQRIRNLSALLAKDADFFVEYPAATDLLHSAIILDTVNFSKEVNKATALDEEIVLFLESMLRPNQFEEERKLKLDRLVEARKDVSSLTAAQLLRKDVKIIGDILVPSFPILVEEFLQKANAIKSVHESLARQECSLALLLGMSLQGGLVRDAAICASGMQDRAMLLAEQLQEWSTPSLQLQRLEAPNNAQCIYFKQYNLSASRKQYLPAVNQFIKDFK